MTNINDELQKLGVDLPAVAKPAANYLPGKNIDKIVTISGQLPMKDGTPQFIGKLGANISIEEGQACAKLCGINILAVLNDICGGDLNQVEQCVRLGIFVNSTPDFTDHPKVANGVSDFIVEVMGEAGNHARAAVGVAGLPFGVAVEVEATFKLK